MSICTCRGAMAHLEHGNAQAGATMKRAALVLLSLVLFAGFVLAVLWGADQYERHQRAERERKEWEAYPRPSTIEAARSLLSRATPAAKAAIDDDLEALSNGTFKGIWEAYELQSSGQKAVIALSKVGEESIWISREMPPGAAARLRTAMGTVDAEYLQLLQRKGYTEKQRQEADAKRAEAVRKWAVKE